MLVILPSHFSSMEQMLMLMLAQLVEAFMCAGGTGFDSPEQTSLTLEGWIMEV